jgi:hypothetical protein
MKLTRSFILSTILLSISGCITKFIPELDENRELLVVEGLLTDRIETNTIRLTKSLPIGKKSNIKPVVGCTVSIIDDLDNSWILKEKGNGYYITDSLKFRGVAGRKYTLRIQSHSSVLNNYSYESLPMELKPVPPIDNLFWEKFLIEEGDDYYAPKEGCEIYLDTHDDTQECKFFRWDFTETWEIILPFVVPNSVCWATNESGSILIQNTSLLSEASVRRFPINFISPATDRLKEKYSIIVNQYSINEQEYEYWDKMKRLTEHSGTLYDIIPFSVPGNIYCVEDPTEKVLGYFSVSSKTSRRIFIADSLSGMVQLYNDCPISPPIPFEEPVPTLGINVWIIYDHSQEVPPYIIYTDKKFCADCTTRGTKIKPPFWDDDILNQR